MTPPREGDGMYLCEMCGVEHPTPREGEVVDFFGAAQGTLHVGKDVRARWAQEGRWA